jgi:2-hydroxycyclohexanecarboxyl-CoA dehydrogenase
MPIRDWSNFIGGRVAVVTGSGAGVGRAIAMHMARAGAELWINDLDGARAADVCAEIEAEGGKARPVVADVCDPASVHAMAEVTGPVDILVNNAGSGIQAFAEQTAHYKAFVDTDPTEWEPVMRVNLTGVLHVTHTYLPGMVDKGWGRILTIVSDAGRKGERNQVVYGAAKAAAMGFSRGLAAEVGRRGVTVNCIALGTTLHGAALDMSEEQERKQAAVYPVGRLGRVDDPAPLAVMLCSDAAEWITGSVYPVDGGYAPSL